MNRRRNTSIAGSPLLIGAVTTLIVVVAVFLSYNANNGLPFVPTYNIKVELPEASGLQPANQVRIGGTRVGTVSSLTAQQNPHTGRVTAIAHLKLQKSVESLPSDTKAIVLSVSAIGLKYLELEKGTASSTIKAGGTIPVSQTREPVEINDLFNTFDAKTRKAIKINSNNFGDGLAARGVGINVTIHELKPLVTNAVPVLNNLANPATGLRELFIALDRVSSQAAPVAETQAAYFTELDTFFAAFASVTKSLEEATRGGPASLRQAIHSLPYEAPFTRKATTFMHLLRPSAAVLRNVSGELGHAFKEGAVNLKAATSLNTKLAESSQALSQFGQNPIVTVALEDFTETLQSAQTLLGGLGPEQAKCNYITLALRNVASLESEDVGVGTLASAGFVLAPTGPNNAGLPSSAPANGPSTELAADKKTIIDNNHLDANPYPSVNGPGQSALCEAGNETFAAGQAHIGAAASSGSSREFTTRSENLFGQPYSSTQTTKLGLKKGASE
jgi:virulence factor Mce-like protein